MTQEQGLEWTRLPEKAVDGFAVAERGLEVFFSRIVCTTCGEDYGEALEQCVGPLGQTVPEGHVWTAFFTLPVDEHEASELADPEGHFSPGAPTSVALICALCGESGEEASPKCSERVRWTEQSALELKPEDFFGQDEANEQGLLPEEEELARAIEAGELTGDVIRDDLPPDGTLVRAKPSGWKTKGQPAYSGEKDHPSLEGVPDELLGPLSSTVNGFTGKRNPIVNGIPADPATVEIVE